MQRYICLEKQSYNDGEYSIVPIRLEDRFKIMRWRNDQIYHLRQNTVLTEEMQNEYFSKVVSKGFTETRPSQILFSYVKNGECLGYGGLVHINWVDHNAEVSFLMATELEDSEFGKHWTHFLKMIEQVAFGSLELNKIFTYAFDVRPKLYSILEACGMVREAVLRRHCLFMAQYIDVVIHSKFRLSNA